MRLGEDGSVGPPREDRGGAGTRGAGDRRNRGAGDRQRSGGTGRGHGRRPRRGGGDGGRALRLSGGEHHGGRRGEHRLVPPGGYGGLRGDRVELEVAEGRGRRRRRQRRPPAGRAAATGSAAPLTLSTGEADVRRPLERRTSEGSGHSITLPQSTKAKLVSTRKCEASVWRSAWKRSIG